MENKKIGIDVAQGKDFSVKGCSTSPHKPFVEAVVFNIEPHPHIPIVSEVIAKSLQQCKSGVKMKKSNRPTVNLYLDDLRDIPEGFVGARTYEEALEILKNNHVGILSLDHDLGEDSNGKELKNGYDLTLTIVEFFEEYDMEIDNIYLHTDNVVGREKMYSLLTRYNSPQRKYIYVNNIYHYPCVPNKYSSNNNPFEGA